MSWKKRVTVPFENPRIIAPPQVIALTQHLVDSGMSVPGSVGGGRASGHTGYVCSLQWEPTIDLLEAFVEHWKGITHYYIESTGERN